MKFLITLFTTLISINAFAIEKIDANQAAFYENENVVACGTLAHVKQFKKGYYLNLGGKYPKQDLTLVLWNDDFQDFTKEHGALASLIRKEVCGAGEIKKYKSFYQLSLDTSKNFTLRNLINKN